MSTTPHHPTFGHTSRKPDEGNAPITVVVADDHRVVRAGLIALLHQYDDVRVVGEAGSGLEAVERAETLAPDVVLMDLQMPVMDGVQATEQIVRRLPATAVLILTTYDDDELIWDGIRAGARGYLLKDVLPDDLIRALRTVAAGGTLLPPTIAAKLAQRIQHHGAAPHPPAAVTPRETEILQHMARGRTNREIAAALHISENTVKTHISNLYQKLEVNDRTEAVTTALRLGLIELR